MVLPYVSGPQDGGPGGDTYAVVLVRGADAGAVTEVLRRLRFSGWIAPARDGWVPIVAVPGAGSVASGRRGVVGVGGALAEQLGGAVLVARVLADRQLALVAWDDGVETGRYVSDPSREPGAGEDVLDDPLGVDAAAAFAAAGGRPERGAEVRELLAERLDPDSFIESERLARLLRLFGLPTWLVAVATLPREIPTGPSRRELTRLGFGLTGPAGVLAARLALVGRRRRRPPPVIADPPQGGSEMDPWLL